MQAQPKIQQLSNEKARQIGDVRFMQLVNTIVAPQNNKSLRTIAFVSITARTGTSSLVAGLGEELVNYTCEPSVLVKMEDLKHTNWDDLEHLRQYYYFTSVRNLLAFNHPCKENSKAKKDKERTPVSPPLLEGSMMVLKRSFSHILVDCPALKSSSDALIIAPMVDGVVLVVEADRTTKEQVTWAQRTIEKANGKLLGVVLNKRRYPIPELIHRWL